MVDLDVLSRVSLLPHAQQNAIRKVETPIHVPLLLPSPLYKNVSVTERKKMEALRTYDDITTILLLVGGPFFWCYQTGCPFLQEASPAYAGGREGVCLYNMHVVRRFLSAITRRYS